MDWSGKGENEGFYVIPENIIMIMENNPRVKNIF